MSNRFDQRLKERGITTLMHFTRAENLPSIVEHGLQPVSELEAAGISFKHNDNHRLDGALDSISLSVTCCNWPMLSKLMDENPTHHWIVLGLDARLMVGWSGCSFFPGNAATSQFARSMRNFRSLSAFEDMFCDRAPYGLYRGASYRNEYGILDRLTTDPQAEVLHRGGIDPVWIKFALVNSTEVGEWADPILNRIPGPERWVYERPFQPAFRAPNQRFFWGIADPNDPDLGDDPEESTECDFSQTPL